MIQGVGFSVPMQDLTQLAPPFNSNGPEQLLHEAVAVRRATALGSNNTPISFATRGVDGWLAEVRKIHKWPESLDIFAAADALATQRLPSASDLAAAWSSVEPCLRGMP